jgi:hypothetical protein
MSLSSNSFHAQARMILNGNVYLRMNAGKVSKPIYSVIGNPASNALTVATGTPKIVSENQYNQLRWWIGSSNSGSYNIPFAGSSPDFSSIPLTLSVTGSGSASGYIDFATYGTPGSNNLPLPDGVVSINHVNVNQPGDGSYVYDRFWLINSSSYVSKPSVSLSFGYMNTEKTGGLSTPGTQLVAQVYNTTTNSWGGSGMLLGMDNGTDQVTNVVVRPDNFEPIWTLVSPQYALPNELIRFDAKWKDEEEKQSQVIWETASEHELDHFQLERSDDGVKWSFIDSIEASGVSNNLLTYTFVDVPSIRKSNFIYKLSTVNINGDILAVKFASLQRLLPESKSLSIYPNPANKELTLSMKGEFENTIHVRVMDQLGKVTLMNEYPLIDKKMVNVDLSGLAHGYYTIQVSDNVNSFTNSFIKM